VDFLSIFEKLKKDALLRNKYCLDRMPNYLCASDNQMLICRIDLLKNFG